MSRLVEIWRLLDRRQRRQLLGLQVLSVFVACSTVGGIAAVVPFFSVLADPAEIHRSRALAFLYEQLRFTSEAAFVVALGVGFALSVLLSNAISLLGALAINRFALGVGNSFHVRLFSEYLRRDYEFHSQVNSAVLVTRVLYETWRVATGMLQQALVLVTNLCIIALILASVLFLDALVTVCAVIALGSCYVLTYALARKRLLRNGRNETSGYIERSQLISESFAAVKEIQVLHVQESFTRRLDALARSLTAGELSTLAISLTPRSVLECATVLCLVGVALYLRSREGVGSWVAQLSFIALAAYRLMPALQQVFTALVKIRASAPAFDSVAEDLRQATSQQAASFGADSGPEPAVALRQGVQLQEVSFRYAPDRAPALSELSLSIPAGASVGVIGANGSGKTTVADILAGLLLPQSGRVSVDGIPLDRQTRQSWQSSIAYVPQHVSVLDATFAENVAPGIPVERIDRRRLEEAVALARLVECVAAFPGGYAERLGERGSRLSGGQRQRLGIARALYRQASLLILDEATSSLDPGAEGDIVDMLDALRPRRTIVHIAHRLASLRHCELIYELRGGRLAQTLSYGELQKTARQRLGAAELQA